MSLKRKSCHLNICLSQLCQHKTQLFNLSCPWVLLLPCASVLEDLKSSLGSRGSGKEQTGACRPGEGIEERWSHPYTGFLRRNCFFFFLLFLMIKILYSVISLLLCQHVQCWEQCLPILWPDFVKVFSGKSQIWLPLNLFSFPVYNS